MAISPERPKRHEDTARCGPLRESSIIMDEIVCRRDEIDNTNEVPFVLGQELPSDRYNSLQFFTYLLFISD